MMTMMHKPYEGHSDISRALFLQGTCPGAGTPLVVLGRKSNQLVFPNAKGINRATVRTLGRILLMLRVGSSSVYGQ